MPGARVRQRADQTGKCLQMPNLGGYMGDVKGSECDGRRVLRILMARCMTGCRKVGLAGTRRVLIPG